MMNTCWQGHCDQMVSSIGTLSQCGMIECQNTRTHTNRFEVLFDIYLVGLPVYLDMFQIMIRSIFLFLDRTYVLQNSSVASLW